MKYSLPREGDWTEIRAVFEREQELHKVIIDQLRIIKDAESELATLKLVL